MRFIDTSVSKALLIDEFNFLSPTLNIPCYNAGCEKRPSSFAAKVTRTIRSIGKVQPYDDSVIGASSDYLLAQGNALLGLVEHLPTYHCISQLMG